MEALETTLDLTLQKSFTNEFLQTSLVLEISIVT